MDCYCSVIERYELDWIHPNVLTVFRVLAGVGSQETLDFGGSDPVNLTIDGTGETQFHSPVQ